MTNRIIHFEIMGSDATQSQTFYSAMFGWKLCDPAPELGNYAMVDGASAVLSGGIGCEGPGGRSLAQFTDPDGNLVGLVKGMR